MNATYVAKQKQRLVELRGRLGIEINRMLEAVQEDAIPPGEHEQRIAPSESIDKEIRLEQNQADIREAVIAAIERIERNDYGKCADCGVKIPQARLNAIPYAQRCVECEGNLQHA